MVICHLVFQNKRYCKRELFRLWKGVVFIICFPGFEKLNVIQTKEKLGNFDS